MVVISIKKLGNATINIKFVIAQRVFGSPLI